MLKLSKIPLALKLVMKIFSLYLANYNSKLCKNRSKLAQYSGVPTKYWQNITLEGNVQKTN